MTDRMAKVLWFCIGAILMLAIVRLWEVLATSVAVALASTLLD